MRARAPADARPPGVHVRLVRHGEVAARHQGTFYGGAEADLSEAGRAAGEIVAARLAGDPPHRILSSPLVRSLILAEDLGRRCGVGVEVLAALCELDRGAWTHKTRAQIEAGDPGAVARYLNDPEAGAAPGGERESELCARVWGVLDEVAEDGAGRRVVIVTHGHVIRVAMRRLLGWSAVESLGRFVPYHGVVEARLWPGGGELLAAPVGEVPEALRQGGASPAADVTVSPACPGTSARRRGRRRAGTRSSRARPSPPG